MTIAGDFPGGPVANTPRFQCRGPGFDPWWNQIKKKKKFNKENSVAKFKKTTLGSPHHHHSISLSI